MDVLIVGAGPTGLTMAVELARRHIDVRVIDALPAPTTETRALGVQPRTLELFDRLELTEATIAAGVPVADFHIFSENKQFLDLSVSRLDTPYPYLLMAPQPRVEEVLTRRLLDYGVKVEREVELTALSQGPGEVQAELLHGDGTTEQAHVPWLIGCDGAHSTVRHRLGVPFVGEAFEENFAVADGRVDWPVPYDVFHAFLNKGRFVAYFPMPGGMHRITIAYPPGHVPQGEVTFEEVRSAVAVCSPPGTRLVEILESGRFRINQRKVARHSVDRVFLAGDAAHVHSVVGGQGMNTGIQDAFNLGWKLAAVVQGRAPAGLLDTYAAERSPVAARLVKGTRRATRMTLLSNPIATAARRILAPHITPLPAVQKPLSRALTQLDVSYRDGSGGSNDDRLAVGDRFPEIGLQHPWKHTLLVFGMEPPTLRSVLGDLDDLIDVRLISDARTRERCGIQDDGLVLVRPDGYLALLGGDVHHLSTYLTTTFGSRRNT
ncbi:FAD-dependent monooxygenase [Nonomuraea angiospora]|uniref:2-polyprenyl-6-methoxyphenol hydroxylase-like FAD-dependent oxidoreductase n=1 Tax=Nonomuraea angiospora TaxID=46172 RepID=A0ABR9LT23_9ACTN|nr:FAD-dependent monooxygenase [Nonomuraea angiospora]MBE1583792.1 2-polyprenyl-6-methoxyphenol hydroxylase-like FAD-dependent oxidoreductase [Nonomuraea angiospora]